MKRCSGARGEGKTYRKLVLVDEDIYKQLTSKNSAKHPDPVKGATLFDKSTATGRITKSENQEEQKLALYAASAEPAPLAGATTEKAGTSVPKAGPADAGEGEELVTEELLVPKPEDDDVQSTSMRTKSKHFKNIKPIPMQGLPQQYHKKYQSLYNKMLESRRFHVDDDGQLMIDKQLINGSNYEDLMRSLFVKSASTETLTGRNRLLAVLNQVITPEEISSSTAREGLKKPKQSLAYSSTHRPDEDDEEEGEGEGEADTTMYYATATADPEQEGEGKKRKRQVKKKRSVGRNVLSSRSAPPGRKPKILFLYK